MINLEKINEKVFEDIKPVDEDNCEYWYESKLKKVLDYTLVMLVI
jgi:hypothetical protein